MMRATHELRSGAPAAGPAARLAAALALVLAVAGQGQTTASAQVPTLDRVDSLITAGDYDRARGDLDRWWSARDQFVVPGSDMARALMLRAQLARDPAAAEPDYLAVVLGYPASDEAPEALLRLAQGLLATGEAARSAAYLGRLVSDYPGRPQRLTGLLWLARANAAARRPGPACTAARQGLEDARDPDLTAMLRVEAESSCSGLAARGEAAPAGLPIGGAAQQRATPAAGAPETTSAGETTTTAPERRAPRPTGASSGRTSESRSGDWAVQSGAFRHMEGAERLTRQLRDAGYSPRLVRVPRNDLLRVRIGRFTSREEADALVTRLRAGGFDAVAVRDAAQERSP